MLPDSFTGAVGESVVLKTDQKLQRQINSVAWDFFLHNSTMISIIISATSNTTHPDYSLRIKLDKITGSLELSSLTLDDSGLYKVFLIPSLGQIQTGECNLQVDGEKNSRI